MAAVGSTIENKILTNVIHPIFDSETARLKEMMGMVLPKQALPLDAVDQVNLSFKKIAEEPAKLSHWLDVGINMLKSVRDVVAHPFMQVDKAVSYLGQPDKLFADVKQVTGGIELDKVLAAPQGNRDAMVDVLKSQAKAANIELTQHPDLPARFALEKDGKALQFGLADNHLSVFTNGQWHHVLPKADKPGTFDVMTPVSLQKEANTASRAMLERFHQNPGQLPDMNDLPELKAVMEKTQPLKEASLQLMPLYTKFVHTPVSDALPTQAEPFLKVTDAITDDIIPTVLKETDPLKMTQQMEQVFKKHTPALDSVMKTFEKQPIISLKEGYAGVKTLLSEQAGLDLGKLYTDKGFVGKDEAKALLGQLAKDGKGWETVDGKPDRFVFRHPEAGYRLTVGVGKDGVGIHGLATNQTTQSMGGPDWHHIFTDEQNQPQLVNAWATQGMKTFKALAETPLGSMVKLTLESSRKAPSPQQQQLMMKELLGSTLPSQLMESAAKKDLK